MVPRLSVNTADSVQFELQVLPRATRKALDFFKTFPGLANNAWYLAGGTALALQVGHRRSVDLDFFLPRKNFDEVKFERQLFNTGKWKNVKATFQKEVPLVLYDFLNLSL